MKYLIALIFTSSLAFAAIQGDSFTYQGKLIENNQPANGTYAFVVEFFDAQTGGVLITSMPNVVTNVSDGLFSLQLDIGDMPFDGNEVWLQLSIAPPPVAIDNTQGIGLPPTVLEPRHLITNSPYAIQSKFVGQNGVSTLSIENAAITGPKIASNAISSAHIINNAISTDDIADNAINSRHITSGAINSNHVAIGALGSANIQDGSINNIDIEIDTITSAQLANNSVTSFEIRANAVNSSKIADGTIVAADINSNSVQRRVSGICPVGSSIRTIATDGTVNCETDDSGSTGWGLTGNSGTNENNNFIGTTDDQAVVIKSNNLQAYYAEYVPNISGGDGFINTVIGEENNRLVYTPGSRMESVGIFAGDSNTLQTNSASSSLLRSTIIGGSGNFMADAQNSAILGGINNKVNGGNFGVILGGNSNEMNANSGLSAGFGSKVNHKGGWVWNDASDLFNPANSLATTDDNQFLIRAVGGVGIGTNAPASPIHIKGEGTSNGSIAGSNEVVLTIEPNDTSSDVAAVINKLSSTKEAALIFATDGQPEFDIRSVNGSAMDFNHYDNNGAQTTVMRINASNRIDINTNFEPFINNSYNIGAPSFRWATIYANNPLDVSSDERLKSNINDISYGLAEIMALKPVIYNWKDGHDRQKHIGLIAQEVETVIPEIVSKNHKNDDMRSMRYTEIIPVLIKATQEQQTLIEQQNQQIKALQASLKSLSLQLPAIYE